MLTVSWNFRLITVVNSAEWYRTKDAFFAWYYTTEAFDEMKREESDFQVTIDHETAPLAMQVSVRFNPRSPSQQRQAEITIIGGDTIHRI